MPNFANVIELGRHIEILLLGNDCVIVPGLGAFVAHHVPARFDERDGVFLPPLRTIGFNPKYVMNDSLLAQSYVEANDTSYPEAVAMVENDVRALRQRLTGKGTVELSSIGTLSVNKEGNIEFRPNEAGILTPDFYALSSLDIMPLAAARAKDNTESAKAITTLAGGQHKPQQPVADHTEPAHTGRKARVISITSDSTTGKQFLSISLNAIRNTAIAALMATAFFLLASPLDLNKGGRPMEQLHSGFLYDFFDTGKPLKPDFLFQPIVLNTTVADKPKPAVTKPAGKPVAKKAVAKKPEAPITTTKAATPAKEHWSIVLCSRVGLKNAEMYAAQIHKDGFAEAIVIDRETNAKVVYGRYTTKEEAQQALRKLNDNKYFKQGWLLKIQG